MTGDLIDIEYEGAKESLDTLRSMSDELQVKAIRYALKFAATPLVSALKATIGRRSGSLAGLVNKVQINSGDPVYAVSPEGFKGGQVRLGAGETGIVVGPNKMAAKFAYLAMILESGAKPHQIGTQYGSLRIGGNFVGRAVDHPGFRGRQIFGPALDKAASDIEGRFYEGLERHLARLN